MPLTDTALRKAKAADKPYRKTDSDGLYALIQPSGAIWWRLDYRLNGVRKTMSMGTYPDISLIVARERRNAARVKVAIGIDPVEDDKKQKRDRAAIREHTFGSVVADYLAHLKKLERSEATLAKKEWLLNDLASELHPKPVIEIKAGDILPILKRIEAEGKRETVRRLRGVIGSVFRFDIANPNSPTEYDPTYALRGQDVFLPVKVQHRAALTDEGGFGGLLRAVDDFDGWITLKAALSMMAICYPRPIELRYAEWDHFDLKKKVWTVPETLSKMRRPHDIPLSRQALEIIERIRSATDHGKYVFPALRGNRSRVISENGMNSALRRMGYTKEEHCSHGFRSSASSILNRRKFDGDVIERSLAHIEQNKVRNAYNRYEYWDERVELAQAWADICDELKTRKRRNNDDLI